MTAVGSDVDNKILAVGDSEGHITVYTLDHCIMRGTEGGPPPGAVTIFCLAPVTPYTQMFFAFSVHK